MATFFATIGPLDVACRLSPRLTATETRRRSADVSMAMCGERTNRDGHSSITFALIGETLSTRRSGDLPRRPAHRGRDTCSCLIGIDMVFARTSGSTSTTDEEEQEALRAKRDIAVFPLATPH